MIERTGLAGLLAVALTACGGTAVRPASPTAPVSSTLTCSPGSAWSATQCQVFAERIAARAPTPFMENGRAVSLEVILYKPLGPGPFPAVLFHHGSTGDGKDRSLFSRTLTSETIAQPRRLPATVIARAQSGGNGSHLQAVREHEGRHYEATRIQQGHRRHRHEPRGKSPPARQP